MKKLLFIGLPILFLLIVGIVSWLYVKSTPQYSLYEMYNAVQAHDYATFIKYADIDSIANNVIDRAMASAQKEETKQEQSDPWEQLGANFAQGFMMTMKPGLIEMVKTSVKKGVEEGDLKGANYKPGNIIDTLTKIKVKQDGKVADVKIPTNDPEPLTLKMRQINGYWQVFDINLDTTSLNTASTKPEDQTSTTKKTMSGDITVSVTPTLIPAVKVAEGDFMTYHYEVAKREDAED